MPLCSVCRLAVADTVAVTDNVLVAALAAVHCTQHVKVAAYGRAAACGEWQDSL